MPARKYVGEKPMKTITHSKQEVSHGHKVDWLIEHLRKPEGIFDATALPHHRDVMEHVGRAIAGTQADKGGNAARSLDEQHQRGALPGLGQEVFDGRAVRLRS